MRRGAWPARSPAAPYAVAAMAALPEVTSVADASVLGDRVLWHRLWRAWPGPRANQGPRRQSKGRKKGEEEEEEEEKGEEEEEEGEEEEEEGGEEQDGREKGKATRRHTTRIGWITQRLDLILLLSD